MTATTVPSNWPLAETHFDIENSSGRSPTRRVAVECWPSLRTRERRTGSSAPSAPDGSSPTILLGGSRQTVGRIHRRPGGQRGAHDVAMSQLGTPGVGRREHPLTSSTMRTRSPLRDLCRHRRRDDRTNLTKWRRAPWKNVGARSHRPRKRAAHLGRGGVAHPAQFRVLRVRAYRRAHRATTATSSRVLTLTAPRNLVRRTPSEP